MIKDMKQNDPDFSVDVLKEYLQMEMYPFG